jgi:signal transduction histidine kinase/ActR/RegA family two-component response regulator
VIPATPVPPTTPSADTSRGALDFLHALLAGPPAGPAGLADVLRGLAEAFGAAGAGLASLPDGAPAAYGGPGGALAPPAPPWEGDRGLLARACEAPGALAAPAPGGGGCLLAAAPDGPGGWLLWLDGRGRAAWTDAEAAALALAARLFAGRAAGDAAPRWARQREGAERQHRLEAAADVTRRLAHDFGNVLTAILGFTELCLGHRGPADGPLHHYLTEAYRGARAGADYVYQLRLFTRRNAARPLPADLAAVLVEEEARVRPQWGAEAGLKVELPPGLPPVGIDSEHLRRVLAALLDNAREAAGGAGGAVRVSARVADLDEADCRDRLGDLRPGPHVEVSVADGGPGLSAEARRRLFAEPFFTTKPRRRGLGLLAAYGILHAHRGGLRLVSGPGGGVVAQVAVPVAAPAEPPPVAPSALDGLSRGERVLVVDDDPMVLHFARLMLERAGYRPQVAAGAEEALAAYAAAGAEPFGLVLSDVVMPGESGVELARRLAACDAGVRVLFMTGQSVGDVPEQEFAGRRVEVLAKPFSPEGLLRAVRAALDRPAPRRGAPAGGGAQGGVAVSSGT